jgi:hypothetical protein
VVVNRAVGFPQDIEDPLAVSVAELAPDLTISLAERHMVDALHLDEEHPDQVLHTLHMLADCKAKVKQNCVPAYEERHPYLFWAGCRCVEIERDLILRIGRVRSDATHCSFPYTYATSPSFMGGESAGADIDPEHRCGRFPRTEAGVQFSLGPGKRASVQFSCPDPIM